MSSVEERGACIDALHQWTRGELASPHERRRIVIVPGSVWAEMHPPSCEDDDVWNSVCYGRDVVELCRRMSEKDLL